MRVRRSFVFILIWVAAGLWGCSGSDNGARPDPGGDALATATIGSDGGTLTGGEATLVVPPGAFADATDLELYTDVAATPFPGHEGSPLYRVEGLPASYEKPLTIRFAVPEGGTDALVAMGERNFSTSVPGMVTGFHMLATVVADTTATASVPAATGPAEDAGGPLPVWFLRVNDYETDAAPTAPGAAPAAVSHFSISYPKGGAALAATLETALEHAYTTFNSWSFSYSRRTSWPVPVTLCVLADTTFGYFTPSRWGNNHGTLEFNINRMDEEEELQATTAHEFFHLGQALYDNRNRWTKARTPSDCFWLDEACSVWCEKYFVARADFASKSRTSREREPFERFHVPADGDGPGFHGYGMAPLIEYLSQRQGKEVVRKIYDYTFAHGNDPVAAVISVQEDPAIVWHPRFLRELFQADLTPDVSLASVVGVNDGTWTIKTAADTKKSFHDEYLDGSARFYKIKPLNPAFGATDVLKLTLDNATDALLNVYKYKGAQLERLGIAAGSFEVTHLDELKRDGWYLMIMATNSHLESPYTAKHSMTLSLEVKKTSGFHQGWANVTGTGNYDIEASNPDSTWTRKDSYYTGWVGGFPGPGPVDGSSEGNTFTASFGGTAQGSSYSGTLTLTVDDTDQPTEVVSFAYTTRIETENGTSATTVLTCSGGGVPLTSSGNDEYHFVVDDASAAGYVSDVQETTTFINGDFRQVSTLRDAEVDYVSILLKR